MRPTLQSKTRVLSTQPFLQAMNTFTCNIITLFLAASLASAQLRPDFYAKSCPSALYTIECAVRSAVARENRMAASLLRLHFHDCFVNGCDGSILLDDTATLIGEKTAKPNNNSVRGFEVIDSIKAQVEAQCPQVVSCADILAVAARDSVVQLGGPTWDVQLGRRDSMTASFDAANSDIPKPTFDLADLTTSFSNTGLSATDMVALSGAHTIGQARCVNFRKRVYSETNIDASLLTSLKSSCPNATGDNNLSPLDTSTPYAFDNFYYRNLLNKKGLLHSDQELFNGGSADTQTTTYSSNPTAFFTDFSAAMVKMGNISPLTGSSGQIRTNCRKVN